MKEKIKEFEKIVSSLIGLDERNVFSDFCYPVIWTDTRASEFYRRILYPDLNLMYNKRKIIRGFFRSFFGYFYCLIYSIFFKRRKFIGVLNKKTELLVVSWIRDEDYMKNDAYLGDLFKDLEKRKRRFQILALPEFNKPAPKFIKDNRVIMTNSRDLNVPGLFFVFGLLINSRRFVREFDFWEKIMFYSALLAPGFLRAIEFYEDFGKLIEGKNKLKKILITWENQSWHKAVCKKAREKGINVYGYAHAGMWNDMIYYAKLRNEKYRKYLPDKVFVHGEVFLDILKDFGWNKNDVILIKSQRKNKLSSKDYFLGKLFLPYDKEESMFVLRRVRDFVRKKIFRIREVQAHPALRDDKNVKDAIKEIKLNDKSRDIVIAGSTSVSYEVFSNKLDFYGISSIPEIQIGQLKGYKGVIIKENLDENLFMASFKGGVKNKFFVFDNKSKEMINYL